jgi:alkanesulfonate monooxygenase SsuD/methylene tetrahydromethanopterin reductase-like flavin-dependent oxidoreductase (luciferase family)
MGGLSAFVPWVAIHWSMPPILWKPVSSTAAAAAGPLASHTGPKAAVCMNPLRVNPFMFPVLAFSAQQLSLHGIDVLREFQGRFI